MSKLHLALSPERQAFREPHALRLVTLKEEGVPIRKLPEGVYGFTGSPASEELPLFINPTFRCFEVHKRNGGAVAIIGYVAANAYDDFQRSAGPLSLDLYPDEHGEATKLISIPLSRIALRKLPVRDGGSYMRVDTTQDSIT
jgi:hypothetical protein